MAALERDYPDAIPGARTSLEAIAAIDAALAGGEALAEPFVTKITRKGAAVPVADPNQLPKRKLDVIEYATELLMEEVATESAIPTTANGGLSSGGQRCSHVENLLLLLLLPRLRAADDVHSACVADAVRRQQPPAAAPGRLPTAREPVTIARHVLECFIQQTRLISSRAG